ncbi:hypothetical protein [Exiguobacterium sp. s162]|uniref:hypothetical protein n=1 Tax=Exiguobacterium sp. s162 TaxID=2751276 RepID=UPI001BE5E2AB|nr:hypothetical protein [Exiguobacterium sp. s162]
MQTNLAPLSTEETKAVGLTTDLWRRIMEGRGQDVTQDKLESAAMIMMQVICTDSVRPSDIMLVDAYPGFGKSALLTSIAASADKLPHPYLIVVPTVERVQQLVNEANADGQIRAIGILSRKNSPTMSYYYDQWDSATNYRVVVLTKAMFDRSVKSRQFDSRLRYYGGPAKWARHILHDEALSVFLTHQITKTELERTFQALYTAVSATDGKKGERAWKKNLRDFTAFQTALSSITDAGNYFTTKIPPINENFVLSPTLQDIYIGHYGIEDGGLEKLAAIQHIIKTGGRITTRPSKGEVGLNLEVYSVEPLANKLPPRTLVTVFDATAAITPDYMALEGTSPFAATMYQRYDNLTIYWNADATFSANWFSKEAYLRNFLNILQKDVLGDEPTLVTAFSDVIKEFEAALSDRINGGYVALKPNNGGLGSNDYNEYNRVVVSGRLSLPIGAQLCIAEFINGGVLESDVFTTTPKGMSFEDETVREYYARRSAANLIQEITRTRPSDAGKGDVVAMVFGMTDEILTILKEHLPGVNLKEFKPVSSRLTGKKSKLEELPEYLDSMPSDVHFLSNRQAYEAIGMSNSKWSKYKKDAYFINILERSGWRLAKNRKGLERITA